MSEETDGIIKKILAQKKLFIWEIVIILIGEAVIGFFAILSQLFVPVIGKIMGVFLVIALDLFVSLACFSQMESKKKLARTLGLVALISAFVAMVLWILVIVDVIPEHDAVGVSIGLRILYLASATAFASYVTAGMVQVEDNTGPVFPLKLTCLVSLMILYVFALINILAGFQIPFGIVYYQLAAFAFVVMMATGIAAVAVSNGVKKQQKKREDGKKAFVPKTDEELRMEIEQKVRSEMIEKEVRAQFEQQMKEQTEYEKQLSEAAEKVADKGSAGEVASSSIPSDGKSAGTGDAPQNGQ